MTGSVYLYIWVKNTSRVKITTVLKCILFKIRNLFNNDKTVEFGIL